MNCPSFATVQCGPLPTHYIGIDAHEQELKKLSQARHQAKTVTRIQRAKDCTFGWALVKGGK